MQLVSQLVVIILQALGYNQLMSTKKLNTYLQLVEQSEP